MEVNRKGETGAIPYRTGRFFNVDAKWYYASRGGIDHGPYSNKSDAAAALASYLSTGNKFNSKSVTQSGQYDSTSSDSVYDIMERQMRPLR